MRPACQQVLTRAALIPFLTRPPSQHVPSLPSFLTSLGHAQAPEGADNAQRKVTGDKLKELWQIQNALINHLMCLRYVLNTCCVCWIRFRYFEIRFRYAQSGAHRFLIWAHSLDKVSKTFEILYISILFAIVDPVCITAGYLQNLETSS